MILTNREVRDCRENAPNKLVGDLVDTLDARAQTIAELTAELDAVRGLAETQSFIQNAGLLDILDTPTKPKEARNE